MDTILSPKKVEKMDIGVLKRGGKGRRFAVSAGIGFDAAVCHEVCVSNGTCVKSSENWKAELCGCGNGSYYKGSASKLEMT